eukprot:9547526-Prorocentrum_lima.AAC.1
MTSSLVGSEMCIRDRLRAPWEYGVRQSLSQQRHWPTSALPLAAAQCYTPVSYTHLTLPTICSV